MTTTYQLTVLVELDVGGLREKYPLIDLGASETPMDSLEQAAGAVGEAIDHFLHRNLGPLCRVQHVRFTAHITDADQREYEMADGWQTAHDMAHLLSDRSLPVTSQRKRAAALASYEAAVARRAEREEARS